MSDQRESGLVEPPVPGPDSPASFEVIAALLGADFTGPRHMDWDERLGGSRGGIRCSDGVLRKLTAVISVAELAGLLDRLHVDNLTAADAARLAIELAGMGCGDLIAPESWPVGKNIFGDLVGFGLGGPLVFTNVRGVWVGLCPSVSVVYKIESPLGTWWTTTYSTDGIEDQDLPLQDDLLTAQLRCEQHRRQNWHARMTAPTTSGS